VSAAIVAVIGTAVAVGATAYGLKRQTKAQSDAAKLQKILQQTPRQRVTQINTKDIPKAQEALTKAQAGGDPKKIQAAQDKLLDLQDEAALVAQTADDQHALASGLFTDVSAPAASQSLAVPNSKTYLVIGGIAAAVAIGAGLSAMRKRK